LKTSSFVYEGFKWTPFHADISLDPNRVSVDVKEANLCGEIATPGTLSVTPKELQFDFKPTAKGQELDPILACAMNKRVLWQANMTLTGKSRPRERQKT
jgi:hypothetical protein